MNPEKHALAFKISAAAAVLLVFIALSGCVSAPATANRSNSSNISASLNFTCRDYCALPENNLCRGYENAAPGLTAGCGLNGAEGNYPDCKCIAVRATSEPPKKGELGGYCGSIAGIPCAPGLECKYDGNYPDAGGKCVQSPAKPSSECSSDADCGTGGCSSQICGLKSQAAGIITTCEWRESYSCYKKTSCGCVEGKCSWKDNSEFQSCLANYSNAAPLSQGNCSAPVSNEASCKSAGGTWGRFGLSPTYKCDLKCSDAGKQCNGESECTGGFCIFDEATANQANASASGNCIATTMGFLGCHSFVSNATAGPELCVD